MYFSIITSQILILALLALVGVVATKLKVITEQVKNSIAALVFNITLPFLIITSVSHVEINKEILNNSILVFILSSVAITLLFFIGRISGKILTLPQKKRNIHLLHTMFGNVAFLGYPLFSALFPGGEGLLYAIIYHLTQDVFIWTIGVFVFNNTKKVKFTRNLKHLLNPNTVSFALGTLMLALGIQFPDYIYKPFYGLGQTTLYIAMLYIGAVLAQNPMMKAFKKPEIYALSFNKMILVPFLLILLIEALQGFTGFHIGEVARTVVVMQAGMPCMAMIVVLAKRFGSDDLHATENLFLSTILSLGTLPLIYLLIQIF
ncbi:MAG: AEC family transporter [Bacteroidales bacterium]|jgi:predicted permease|nr:AEC family transporter [Bacteroidales bacterium]